jgi:hypothetical protein
MCKTLFPVGPLQHALYVILCLYLHFFIYSVVREREREREGGSYET